MCVFTKATSNTRNGVVKVLLTIRHPGDGASGLSR
jgi:hypothetical protein